jgi:hypothetical protein
MPAIFCPAFLIAMHAHSQNLELLLRVGARNGNTLRRQPAYIYQNGKPIALFFAFIYALNPKDFLAPNIIVPRLVDCNFYKTGLLPTLGKASFDNPESKLNDCLSTHRIRSLSTPPQQYNCCLHPQSLFLTLRAPPRPPIASLLALR